VENFSSFCDDFYIDLYINTELELPSERDTLLTFFERIQKHFPSMCSFRRRDNGELYLEGDRDSGQYRWVSVEADRIGSGYVNPTSFARAYEQHRLVIELMPYMLGVNHLDINSVDVSFRRFKR